MKWIMFVLSLITSLQAANTLIVSMSGDSNEPTGLFYNGKGDLRGCLNFINESNETDFEIQFQISNPTIVLADSLQVGNFMRARNIKINGWNAKTGTPVAIDGQQKYRVFMVNHGNVTFENMTIQNGTAFGNLSSGGGLGAGGAIFVYKTAHVTLKNITMIGCQAIGGNGSFGGWGIGGNYANLSNGGDGGFGGGGGAGPAGVPGAGGVAGGQGSLCAGGGGGALGGAIFVMQDEGVSGSLILRGNITTESCSVIAGEGGCLTATAGAAAAPDLFIMHGTTLLCNPALSEKITFNGIGDDSAATLPPGHGYTPGNSPGAGIEIFGDGEVVLLGTNTYSGQTDVRKGTLIVAGSVSSPVRVSPFGMLQGEGTIAGHVTIQGIMGGNLSVGSATIEDQAALKIDLKAESISKLTSGGDVKIYPGAILHVISETENLFKNRYHIIHSENGIISGADGFVIRSSDPNVRWIIDPASTDRDLFIQANP